MPVLRAALHHAASSLGAARVLPPAPTRRRRAHRAPDQAEPLTDPVPASVGTRSTPTTAPGPAAALGPPPTTTTSAGHPATTTPCPTIAWLDCAALLVGSSGGHLAQLHALADLWPARSRQWVTFDTPDAVSVLAEEEVVWAYHPTTRNLVNLVRNTGLAWRLLRRNRPDVIVSTGAAVAFPFFVLATLWRIPTVFIEVYDRLDTPTLTGRLCRPWASLFLVQWQEQLSFHPRAIVVGPLL